MSSFLHGDHTIAEIRAEGRKMLAKYRNADGDSTDEAKAIELWFWGWVDELLSPYPN